MKRLTTLAVTLSALIVVAGCGGDDKPKPGSEGTSSKGTGIDEQYPSCDDVWASGKTLAEDYEGCMDGDTVVDLAYTACEDGETRMQVHQTAAGENTFIAITGQAIRAYTDEADSELYAKCRPSNAG